MVTGVLSVTTVQSSMLTEGTVCEATKFPGFMEVEEL